MIFRSLKRAKTIALLTIVPEFAGKHGETIDEKKTFNGDGLVVAKPLTNHCYHKKHYHSSVVKKLPSLKSNTHCALLKLHSVSKVNVFAKETLKSQSPSEV